MMFTSYTLARIAIEAHLHDQCHDPAFDEMAAGLTTTEIYDTLTDIYGDLPFTLDHFKQYAAKECLQ